MHVLVMVDARELKRADAERMCEDELRRLLLSAQTPFRSDLVGLRERCALTKNFSDLRDVLCRGEKSDGEGAGNA